MSTDYRALCAELTDVLAELPFGTCEELVIRARAALASPGSGLPQRPENFEFALDFLGGPENDELLAYVEQLEARAALAADGPVVQSREPASVVGEPSDEELNRLLWYEFTTSTGHGERTDPIGFARAVLARWGHQPAPAVETDAILALAAIIREVDGNHSLGAAALAEAILSHRDNRWGHQPAPPVAGEVGELVGALRTMPLGIDAVDPTKDSVILTRAADLLAQRYPEPVPALPEDATVIEPSERTILVPVPEPVPVSERLPGDQLCWWFEADEDCGYGSNWTLLRIRGSATGYTHWLPAHALPLPAGEVE